MCLCVCAADCSQYKTENEVCLTPLLHLLIISGILPLILSVSVLLSVSLLVPLFASALFLLAFPFGICITICHIQIILIGDVIFKYFLFS